MGMRSSIVENCVGKRDSKSNEKEMETVKEDRQEQGGNKDR